MKKLFLLALLLPRLAWAAPTLGNMGVNPTHNEIVNSTHTTNSVTITTTGASLIVVVVTAFGQSGNMLPGVVAGGGLTWSRATGASGAVNAFGSEWTAVEQWWAASSGALTSQTITETFAASTIQSGIAVYSVTGANATPVGVSNTASNATPGSPTTANVTLSSTATTSLGFVALMDGGQLGSAFTARTENTPFDATNVDAGNARSGAIGHGNITTTSITMGSTNSTSAWMVGAMEILAAGGAAAATPMRTLMGVGQ